MSKVKQQEESLFATQPLTGEQATTAAPAQHLVDNIAGMLNQHTTGGRKLSTVERIDLDHIARTALKEAKQRLG